MVDQRADERPVGDKLTTVFDALLKRYGPQDWWPGDSPFEMMVGAILTQAASWTNVEKAIVNLKEADALSPRAIRDMDVDELAQLVYPSGYYNAKARKLKALAHFLGARYGDDLGAMASTDIGPLRDELLAISGIGQETADDILLYPLGKPAFVVDNYTRRLLYRLGLAPETWPYASYRSLFLGSLPENTTMFAEFHALIVRHGKESCRKRPMCAGCCLADICPTGQAANAGLP